MRRESPVVAKKGESWLGDLLMFGVTWGAGDLISTGLALKAGAREANPLARRVIDKTGLGGLALLKVAGLVTIGLCAKQASLTETKQEIKTWLRWGSALGMVLTLSNLQVTMRARAERWSIDNEEVGRQGEGHWTRAMRR